MKLDIINVLVTKEKGVSVCCACLHVCVFVQLLHHVQGLGICSILVATYER